MRGQVSYASYSIALHFNIRTEHLANKRLQATEFDDEQLVVSCRTTLAITSTKAADIRTIYSEVSECRAGSPLHFGVMTAEKEEVLRLTTERKELLFIAERERKEALALKDKDAKLRQVCGKSICAERQV